MINLLKPLKNDVEHSWLYEVSNTSLQIICGDLDKAYSNFFKKITGFPKFKSKKHSKPNFPVCAGRFYFTEKFVQIQKIGKVKYKTDFDMPCEKETKYINPRVSFVNNKWILTVSLECENQVHKLTDINMGIDLGVKDLAVVEFNNEKIVFHNINKSKKVRILKKRIVNKLREVLRQMFCE